MKGKIAILLVTCAVLVQLLSMMPAQAASDTVDYQPVTFAYGIMNAQAYQNSQFYYYYVKNAGALYNAADKFSGLSRGTTYTRMSGTYTWSSALGVTTQVTSSGASYWRWTPTSLGDIAASGQLLMNVSATLKNVRHHHGGYFTGYNTTAYQQAVLQSGQSWRAISGFTFISDGTTSMRLGDLEYSSVNAVYDDLSLRVFTSEYPHQCGDGNCTIGDFVVSFADATAPTISKIYTSDESGTADDTFKPGDTAYLKVEMSEPVRLASNDPTSDAGLTVYLKYGSETDARIAATLSAVKDDYLLFKFTVPSNLPTTWTVTSADLSSLFHSDADLTLRLITGSTTSSDWLNTTVFNGEGFTTTTSYITDIAGNALRQPTSVSSVALTSAAYLDGEAPCVKSVSKTAVMNNADVKAALGKTDPQDTDYTDNSDTRAGVGDSITYTAVFNEKLAISAGSYTGMTATLNVEQSGTSVTLRSVSAAHVSAGVNEDTGASKGYVTQVTFAPLVLTDGMTCTDGSIKITSITATDAVTDLCGNAYNGSEALTNANPLILDVTPPAVKTTISENSGKYTPTAEEPTGAFCFPISITDDSGTNALSGSFTWVNNGTDGESYAFQYAVTTVAKTSDSTKWLSGQMGQSYAFTQVEAGNYIHIRLDSATSYNLADTTLRVTTRDYAGNSGNTDFSLDYAADNFAPVVTLDKTDKTYDSNVGTFTATVTITDKTGLKQAAYFWSEGDTDPDANTEGWIPIGGITDNPTSFTAGITNTSPFSAALYVRAEDGYGNVSVTKLGNFAYNTSDPAHTLTYTEEKTAKASLGVSGLASGGVLAVLVESPFNTDDKGSNSKTYYVRVIQDSGSYDIFAQGTATNSTSGWYTYRVTQSDGGYTFMPVSGTDYTNFNKVLGGTYYGTLNVTVLTGQTDAFAFENGAPQSAGTDTAYPVYAQSFTLSAASGTVTSNTGRYTVTGSASGANTYLSSVNKGSSLSLSSPTFTPGTAAVASTLEGTAVTVNIVNADIPDWGISDIDFSQSSLVIYCQEGNSSAALTKVGTVALAPQASQTVTLPELNYLSGRYTLKVTLHQKASGSDLTYDLGGVVLYCDSTAAATDFGFAGFLSKVSDTSIHSSQRKSYTWYGPGSTYDYATWNGLSEYTAGSQTVYLPVNSQISGSSTRLYFTAAEDDPTVVVADSEGTYYGARAIKAWNVTAGVDAAASKAASGWLALVDAAETGNNSRFDSYSAAWVDEASKVVGATESGTLALIKNKLNTVAIQVANANGQLSEVRYVYLYPVDSTLSGTVSTTSTENYVTAGTLTVTMGDGQNLQGVSVFVNDTYSTTAPPVDITDSYDAASNSYTMALTQSESHNYAVYTKDSAGNFTILGSALWAKTDAGAPTVTAGAAENTAGANFKVTFTLTDDTIRYKKSQSLSLWFSKDYMKALGLSYAETASTATAADGTQQTVTVYTGDRWTLTLPLSEDGTVYEAGEATNPYGIYKVEVQDANNYKQVTVTVYGTVRFDEDKQAGETLSPTLYAAFTDALGNTADPVSVPVSVLNTKPAYQSAALVRYGWSNSYIRLDASFNTPVRIPALYANGTPAAYGTEKQGELRIFADGTYDIRFTDIFGTEWTQTVTLTDVFGKWGVSLGLSETGYTAGPVDVLLESDSAETTFRVWDGSAGTQLGTIWNYVNQGFQLTQNTQMKVALQNGNESAIEYLYIVNILGSAPQATLHWYFDEFQSDTIPTGVTETTGSVTVTYSADRTVTPAEGTAASYTFTPYDGVTSYTFRYTDEAGNAGSITADLADLHLTLKAPKNPPADTDKPTYELYIYGKIDGKYYGPAYWGGTDTLSAVLENAGYVQDYYIDIAASDASAYRILLLDGASTDMSGVTYATPSAAVDGVTLSGRTLTITKAANFTVVLVDSSGNKTAFAVSIGTYLDNTAPTVEIKKNYTTLYDLTVYARGMDKNDAGNDTDTAALLSPSGLALQTDGAYVGYYSYAFSENGSITFTFQDEAGNKGSTTVSVDSLDTTAPTVYSVVWSPYSRSSDSYSANLPPNNVTNGDVTAKVTYSKAIEAYQVFFKQASSDWMDVTDTLSTYQDYFSLSTASDGATVTFHQGNVSVKLIATAPNGKSVEKELSLDGVIDKTAPTVPYTIIYTTNSGFSVPVSAVITLTPNEDVYLAGKHYDADKAISFTVYASGDYTYLFTDAAGNRKAVTVTVGKDIDRTPPKLTVTVPDSGLSTGVTVTASMDEAGTISANGGTQTPASAGQEISISITANGSYTVTGTDLAGNTASTVFYVGTIDKRPPDITFEASTVSIRQDSASDELTALLDAGVTVTDDMSKNITPSYDASGVTLSKPGVYSVVYTAADEAGNQSTKTRFVKVYSKDALEVLVNGSKTEDGGTAVVSSRTVTLKITNPSGSEPYTVYLRAGLKTAGQMKSGFTVVQTDANGRFTLPADGFFTLYIVTQSRQTYLTRLYVQP